MIKIKPSPTADTRTCDVSKVSEECLIASSKQHIGDVALALEYFRDYLLIAAMHHDWDKLAEIEWFHSDFKTRFEKHSWWDHHRQCSRHHLGKEDGIPDNVNLLDVLEFIADCVMAGMARSGSVYPLVLTDALLQRAFQNTIELIKSQVEVDRGE